MKKLSPLFLMVTVLCFVVQNAWSWDPFVDDLFEVKVYSTFQEINANPKNFHNKKVTIPIQLKGTGNLFVNYLSEFKSDRHVNLHAWDGHAKLWDDREAHNIFTTLYMDKKHKEFDTMRALPKYKRLIVTGTVKYVIENIPLIEIEKISVNHQHHFTDKSLKNIRKGLAWTDREEFVAANDHINHAIKLGLPKFAQDDMNIQIGDNLVAMSDYEGAIKSYKLAIGQHNWEPQRTQKYINALLMNNQLDKIEHPADKLLKADPENYAGYLGKGVALANQGKFKEGIAYLDKAIFRAPKLGAGYYWKGWSHRQLNDLKEATKNYRIAIVKEPKNERYRAELADTLFVRELYIESAPEYQILTYELKIENPFYPYRLALCYKELEKVGLTIKNLEKSLKFERNYLPSLKVLSEIYFEHKEFDRAQDLLERVRTLDKQDAEARLRLALIHWRNQKLDQAEKLFYEVITIDEMHEKGRYLLARLSYQVEKVAQSFKHFEFLIKHYPDNNEIRMDYAMRAVDQKNYRLSVTHFEKLKDVPDMRSRSLMNLGFGYLELGKVQQSEAAYQAAIEHDPKLALAYNNLAYLYLTDLPNYEKGVVLAKKAYELNSTSEAILDTLGWAYYLQGNYQEALKKLAKAAESSDVVEIHYHLGLCHIKLQNWDKAKGILSSLKTDNRKEQRQIADALDMLEKEREMALKAAGVKDVQKKRIDHGPNKRDGR